MIYGMMGDVLSVIKLKFANPPDRKSSLSSTASSSESNLPTSGKKSTTHEVKTVSKSKMRASKSEPNTQVTKDLCKWIVSTTWDSVPVEVRTRAKYLLLDGISCALVGARLPWSARGVDVFSEIESPGKCSIIGWNKRMGPLQAALINSSFVQAFEMDDFHMEAPMHANSIILPALFAAAEQEERPVGGKDFLVSIIVGYESGPRVGKAVGGPKLLALGWHPGPVYGTASSSAAVSKLLGLSVDQVEDSMGMACTQACGLMSCQYESDIKRMQHGFAARAGLMATYLARGNYAGIKMVFDREYGGFLNQFSLGIDKEPRYNVEEVSKGLGEQWQTMNLQVKAYAAMAGIHGTIDCVRALQDKYPERMKDVSNIDHMKFEMAEAAFAHGGWTPTPPLNSCGAQMSNAYCAALQLIDGEVSPARFAAHLLNRKELWDIIPNIKCTAPTDLMMSWEQRGHVTFKNGETLSVVVKAPRGIDPPLSNDGIVEKWRSATKNVISEKRQRAIEQVVLNIENSADVMGDLRELLIDETANILA